MVQSVRRPVAVVLGLATAIAAGLLGVPAQARTADPVDPPAYRVVPSEKGLRHATDPLLRRGGKGLAVVRALGDRLPEAAARNGMSAKKLKQVLVSDSTSRLGRSGQLYFVEPAPDQAALAAAASSAQGTVVAAADAATLHSRPTSPHKIYLDFDGVQLTSASWWPTDPFRPIAVGSYPGIVVDGTAPTITEAAYMETVWRIVSERYSPFDVDVTTQDPGPAGLNRSDGDDDTYGDRVVFISGTGPGTARGQACGTCAGTAYVDVFNTIDSGGGDPVWVFTAATGGLGSGGAALAAQVANHEIGHTLSLLHDGIGATEYYDGGAGPWNPVMGVANWYAFQQFSKGEYTGATNTEDDLALIATHGAPLLPDDWGTTATAPSGLGVQESYALDGIISSAADDDTFTVTRQCVGDLTATATGIGQGQSLDLKVDVLNADGSSLLATDKMGSGMIPASGVFLPADDDASATVPAAPAETYRVRVDGVGDGNVLVNGFSDYGSIGQYHLTITGCVGTGGEAPSEPTSVIASATPGTTNGSVSWSEPVTPGDGTVTGYTVSGVPGGPYVINDPDDLDQDLSGLVPGDSYTVAVTAENEFGSSPAATATLDVPTFAPTTAPTSSAIVTGTSVTIYFDEPAPNPGNAILIGWQLQLLRGATVAMPTTPFSAYAAWVGFTNLSPANYTAKITPLYDADIQTGVATKSQPFSIAVKPSAPRIGTASTGAIGRPVNARARWLAPVSTGNAAITGYRVKAYKLNSRNQVMRTITSTLRPASARTYVMPLPAGRYKFKVVAYNRIGASALSAYSRIVTAR